MLSRYFLNWGKENSRFHCVHFQGTLKLQLEYVDFQLDLYALSLVLYTHTLRAHPHTDTFSLQTLIRLGFASFACFIHE